MRLFHLCVGAILLVTLCCTLSSSTQQSLATNKPIDGPDSLAIDGNGHLFVSSLYERVVRRVDLQTGAIETVAGNGKECCYKDGAKATEVSLDDVWAIAVNSYGDLFISEGSQVRRVDAVTGRISTFVGSGDDNTTTTQDGLLATSASFSMIWGMAADAQDDLFIADTGQSRIFKVESAGRTSGKVYAVAGNGKEGFSGDGGPAINAAFDSPESIAFNQDGSLLVADRQNCRIRRVDLKSGIVDTILATAPLKECKDSVTHNWPLPSPDGLTVGYGDTIFFSETPLNLVERLDRNSTTPIILAGTGDGGFSGDGGAASNAILSQPAGLAFDSHGNLFISDLVNNRVRRVDATTKRIQTVVGNGLPHVIHSEE